MRPMHKSGKRPWKLSKLYKRFSIWDLELCIPDNKGSERMERREIERKAITGDEK